MESLSSFPGISGGRGLVFPNKRFSQVLVSCSYCYIMFGIEGHGFPFPLFAELTRFPLQGALGG